MRIVEKLALPLALAVFFVAGTGCSEQEQKARDEGTEIYQSLHKGTDAAKDVVGSANKPLEQLEKNLGEAEAEEE